MAVYYLSKWRKQWIEFKTQPPSDGELKGMEKYNYKIIEDYASRNKNK